MPSDNPMNPVAALSPSWFQAFQVASQQTAQAHIAYQQAMAQSHLAYMQAAQASFVGLAQLSGNPMSLAPLSAFEATPAITMPPPTMAAESPTPVSVPFSAPLNTAPTVPFAVVEPALVVASVPVIPAASEITASPASETDVKGLLLEVVADKTGYPVEMLGLEMTLEGDLGVDSIKRVEILSAMQERAPHLPEVDAGAMASLQTIGEIVEHMGATLGHVSLDSAATVAVEAVKDSSISMTPENVQQLLLEVVADKTGYPVEMLEMGMSLEGDLGVDSIKRVEILSAVQERAPELPEVDAGAMASLQTLGEIVNHIQI